MANGDENKYAARLQQARQEDIARQRGNKQQQQIAEAATDPEWRPKPEHKINGIQAILLLGTALVADIASLVPFVNMLVWVFATLGFGLWLWSLGAISWKDAKTKRSLLFFGGGSLAEFIPALSSFLFWTISIITIIITDRVKSALEKLPAPAGVKKALEKAV